MILIILNIVFCLAFIVFAWFNLNDRDAWLWAPIYLLAAGLCGAAAFGHYYPLVTLIALAFYLVYAVILFFRKDGVWDWLTKYNRQHIAQSMQATKPYIENTREFFGLLIISAALGLNLAVSFPV